MRTLKIVLSVVVLGFTNFAYAAGGNRVGNGGDVIACGKKMQVLDLYENADLLKTFEGNKSTHEILEAVLKNMERFNPRQAIQYRVRSEQFLSETDFKPGISLPDIKDSKHLFTPKDKNCRLVQAAIRRNEVGIDGKRFIVDQEIWNKLPPQSQAALILHEIIYEHLYKLGEEDSVRARKMNAFLFSKKAFDADTEAYWRLVKELKLPLYR